MKDLLKSKNKRGIVWQEIGWWVIGLAVLALVIIALFLMQKQGFNLLEKLKEMLRFR